MDGASAWKGRRIHFVGIGGAGMSGLARIALQLGASVSGSDRAGGEVLAELAAAGAQVSVGHVAENVPEGADVVFSSAVSADNPERARARETGSQEIHRSGLLGELTRLRPTIAVTGTHGKTTTTAMIVSALRGAGMDPGWAVGADLAGGEANAGWGSGGWFVVEADESDRSLLALDPTIAVVTNCELDHHATYESLEDLRGTLSRFVGMAGHAVVWSGDDLSSLAPAGSAVQVVEYGAPDATSGPDGARFGWHGQEVQLSVPGIHNAINAAGALEAAALAGAEAAGAIEGVSSFAGTGRRFERLGRTGSGALVVDDYAHHPTEVAATIAAARSLGHRRVVAVFQPHLYSRTQAFAREFGEALAAADLAWVLDVYPAREAAADFPGVDAGLIVDAGNEVGEGCRLSAAGNIDAAAELVAPELRDGDICLVLGAGDVWKLGRELVA